MFPRPILPNIDDLKRRHSLIHYFGLGFIQIKMESAWQRFHFYTISLPYKKEGIHNHRYSFKSRVLRGSLINTIWNVVSGDTHIERSVSCKAGEEGKKVVGQYRSLDSFAVIHNLQEGSEYTMNYRTFHQVESPMGGITEVNPGTVMQQFAQVVDPINAAPECPFANPGKPDDLWQIVDSMLKETW